MTAVRIVIHKAQRRLTLTTAYGTEHNYPVALGRNSAADKTNKGDHAMPPGTFYVCAKNPRSKYFLSLCLSYPNEEDAERGLATGIIGMVEYAQILDALREGKIPPQKTALGGEIYIHGHASSGGNLQERDWTRGCTAVDNATLQVIYDLANLGTPVLIVA